VSRDLDGRAADLGTPIASDILLKEKDLSRVYAAGLLWEKMKDGDLQEDRVSNYRRR